MVKKTKGCGKGWSPERRAAQAERMKAQKAWKHSTGPKTTEGKAASAANAHKHGMRSAAVAELEAALKIQAQHIKAFMAGEKL